jgi:hypothetical protein
MGFKIFPHYLKEWGFLLPSSLPGMFPFQRISETIFIY